MHTCKQVLTNTEQMGKPRKLQLLIQPFSRWRDPKGQTWLTLSTFQRKPDGPLEGIEMIWLEQETKHVFEYDRIERAIVTGNFKPVPIGRL